MSMFIALILQDFQVEPTDYSPISPLPIVIDSGKMVGFLPVYNTKADALADYPTAKIIEIREVPNEAKQ